MSKYAPELDALASNLDNGSYEDAARWLCILLEECRQKIRTHDGMMFSDLESLVRYYSVRT